VVTDKVMSLTDAVERIPDQATIGVHGASIQGSPMAVLRELGRSRRQGLHVVTLGGSIGIDWLAALGALDRCTFCVLSMEHFGMCPAIRRGIERGSITAEELSETGLYARIGAAARGLPFLTTRGMVGTDLLAVNEQNLRLIDDPFGGGPVVACRALPLDVAVVHAHRADASGNIAMDPTVRYPTATLMPRAAAHVIVTVEQIVGSHVLRREPDRTILPGFVVDAVVEVPFGAHPTSLHPRYTYDPVLHQEWVEAFAAKDAAGFLQRYVLAPTSQAEYLEAIGGSERLSGLTPAVR
jgi:glutaconate CoA-transferase subunit A